MAKAEKVKFVVTIEKVSYVSMKELDTSKF